MELTPPNYPNFHLAHPGQSWTVFGLYKERRLIREGPLSFTSTHAQGVFWISGVWFSATYPPVFWTLDVGEILYLVYP